MPLKERSSVARVIETVGVALVIVNSASVSPILSSVSKWKYLTYWPGAAVLMSATS